MGIAGTNNTAIVPWTEVANEAFHLVSLSYSGVTGNITIFVVGVEQINLILIGTPTPTPLFSNLLRLGVNHTYNGRHVTMELAER